MKIWGQTEFREFQMCYEKLGMNIKKSCCKLLVVMLQNIEKKSSHRSQQRVNLFCWILINVRKDRARFNLKPLVLLLDVNKILVNQTTAFN